MTGIVVPGFRGFIGQRIQAEHQLLTSRWLDELKQLVPVADEIFPSDELSGRAPDLIMELGACFGAPINEPITANAPMTIKATERRSVHGDHHAATRGIQSDGHTRAPATSRDVPVRSQVARY
jgi:hypothetical protein